MKLPLDIRRFDESDFRDVRLVLSETWAQSYSEAGLLGAMYMLLDDESLTFLLPKAGETALMAFVSEKPAGVLVTRRLRSVDCILALYVRPLFQRRGVGRALISHAVREVPALAILEAEVMEASTAALAFYRALGFVEAGRQCLRSDKGQPLDIVTMRVERRCLVQREE